MEVRREKNAQILWREIEDAQSYLYMVARAQVKPGYQKS